MYTVYSANTVYNCTESKTTGNVKPEQAKQSTDKTTAQDKALVIAG